MKKINIIAITLILLLLNIANGQTSNKNDSISKLQQYRTYLKELAFCHCLMMSFPNDSLLKYDGSQDVYLQIGRHSIEAVNVIVDFTDNYVNRYLNRTKFGDNLYVKKCIDLRNSNDLDSIVRKLDNEIYEIEDVDKKYK